jgi:alpha-galactosidase
MKISRSSLNWLSWNIATAALVAACGTAPEAGASAEVEQVTPEPVDLPTTAADRTSSTTDDREQDRPTVAVGDGLVMSLARTPPMGFNDWNAFGCNVSEQLIKETADFFVSSGLKDAGYQFVNIDDCWALRQRGPDGRLVPDPEKFPSGISGTADYVHGLGLKLGLYADAGTATCAGYPGSLGHEQIDAETFASWGVDYLKYDNCNNNSDGSRADFVRRYSAMGNALRASGRSIVYSICEWGQVQPWEWAGDIGQLWRTTGDIQDNWASLSSIIAQNAPLFWAARPGAWNDPDMLEIGNGGMTTREYETHFSMWAMMASPLLIGTDLRRASADTLRILSNAEVIAVDQDRLGVQAQVLYDLAGKMVLGRPLIDGDRAVALYNSTAAPATISIRAVQTGLPRADAYRLKNLWTGETTQATNTISASVPPHATVMYRVRPLHDAGRFPPATTLGVDVTGAVPGAAGPALVAGRPGPLTATFTNLGADPVRSVVLSAQLPPGFTLVADGDTSTRSVASGGSFAAHWIIGVGPDIAPGSYDLTVTATYSWGRHRTQATATSLVTAQVLAPPPSGVAALSSLSWVSVSNGWGPVEKDISNGEQATGDGGPITIGGRVYAHGLGAHAPGEIVYYLGGVCSALTTDVGIDDEKSANGSASFRIYADDRLVADSGTRTVADPALTLTANLSGATWLRLVADPGPSTDSDHTDWAEPILTCATR